MIQSQPPVLVAAPGMQVDELAARSTVELTRWHRFGAVRLTQTRGEHVVRLAVAAGLDLPTGLLTFLECRNERVARVTATPHMNYLDGDETLALIETVNERLLRAGWFAVRSDPLLAKAVARLPATPSETVGQWMHKRTHARAIATRVHHRTGEIAQAMGRHDDAYRVDVVVGHWPVPGG